MTHDDPCPGVGRCHNASWCASCEVTQYGPCDVRARGERCDSHPTRALDAARADDASRFTKSLERASAVVKTWPLWKQQVLG